MTLLINKNHNRRQDSFLLPVVIENFIMRILIISLLFLAASNLWAQNILTELQSNVPGQGHVTINQSSAIGTLVGYRTSTSSSDGKFIKTAGFRIQLYAGNNSRVSRDEAYKYAEIAKKAYPEYGVYTIFQSPRWLCQFGDFRTIEEADAMMRELKANEAFSNIVIVKSPIVIKIEE